MRREYLPLLADRLTVDSGLFCEAARQGRAMMLERRPTAAIEDPQLADLSHIDEQGRARMVDVGDKQETQRTAIAQGAVKMQPATLATILAGDAKKGDVLGTARIAGIMAAKRTHELIPLCHPLLLTKVSVEIEPDENLPGLRVTALARVTGKTGVEMEALTAVSVAALTVYDMCKAVDRGMRLSDISLVHKAGGKSGDYWNSDDG